MPTAILKLNLGWVHWIQPPLLEMKQLRQHSKENVDIAVRFSGRPALRWRWGWRSLSGSALGPGTPGRERREAGLGRVRSQAGRTWPQQKLQGALKMEDPSELSWAGDVGPGIYHLVDQPLDAGHPRTRAWAWARRLSSAKVVPRGGWEQRALCQRSLSHLIPKERLWNQPHKALNPVSAASELLS